MKSNQCWKVLIFPGTVHYHYHHHHHQKEAAEFPTGLSKKTDRRFRPSLTKKEIEVLEEKLQGIEFFSNYCSYSGFVLLFVFRTSPNSFYVDT
jgi:hypothetical protein